MTTGIMTTMTMRTTTTRLVALVAVMAALLLGPGAAPASAHAYLERSSPADGEILLRAPKELKLWFTEPLAGQVSTVKLLDSAGQPVPGTTQSVGGDSLLLLTLGSLPPDSYTVQWQVLSVDTHMTKGSMTFTIQGEGGSSATPTLPAPDPVTPGSEPGPAVPPKTGQPAPAPTPATPGQPAPAPVPAEPERSAPTQPVAPAPSPSQPSVDPSTETSGPPTQAEPTLESPQPETGSPWLGLGAGAALLALAGLAWIVAKRSRRGS